MSDLQTNEETIKTPVTFFVPLQNSEDNDEVEVTSREEKKTGTVSYFIPLEEPLQDVEEKLRAAEEKYKGVAFYVPVKLRKSEDTFKRKYNKFQKIHPAYPRSYAEFIEHPERLTRRFQRRLRKKSKKKEKSKLIIFGHKMRQCYKKVGTFIQELSSKPDLWKHSLKIIEGFHGSSVASYFRFLRWCFFLDVWLSLFVVSLIVVPQVACPPLSYSSATAGSGNMSARVALVDACATAYRKLLKQSLRHFSDFLEGAEWMEDTILFYGFYESHELCSTVSRYNMPLAYLVVAICCLLFSVSMVAKTSVEYFSKWHLKTKPQTPFFDLVFTRWSYSVTDRESVLMNKRILKHEIAADKIRREYLEKYECMTAREKRILLATRIAVNGVILGCGAASLAVIGLSTTVDSEVVLPPDYKNLNRFYKFVRRFVPPVVFTALNCFLPIIFAKIVVLEDYFPGKDVILTLVRTVFFKFASLGFFIYNFYKQTICTSKDKCGLGQEGCVSIYCWETFFGQQFYRLTITDFIATIFMSLIVDPLRKLILTSSANSFIQLGHPEFNVSKNVLNLIYLQSLCWLGLFYAPLLPVIILIKLLTHFYLKKISAIYFCLPAVHPFETSKSSHLFLIVMLITVFLSCLPFAFFTLIMTPSRSCGPYRLFNHSFDIIEITVNSWSVSRKVTWNLMTSSVLVIMLMLILLFIIYWYVTETAVQAEQIRHLREQLNRERKEKKYFMFLVYMKQLKASIMRKLKESSLFDIFSSIKYSEYQESESETELNKEPNTNM